MLFLSILFTLLHTSFDPSSPLSLVVCKVENVNVLVNFSQSSSPWFTSVDPWHLFLVLCEIENVNVVLNWIRLSILGVTLGDWLGLIMVFFCKIVVSL